MIEGKAKEEITMSRLSPELSSSLSSMSSSFVEVSTRGSLKLALSGSLRNSGHYSSLVGSSLSSPGSPTSSHISTFDSSVPFTSLPVKVPNHAATALDSLRKMRETGELCDVVINVDDRASIPAHKVILAAISPYFQAMFSDEMAEKSQKTIRIYEIDPDAMKQLVDYAYSGDMLITEDNVQALLPASSLLQMSLVREACCKFLLRQLHPSNCLGIRTFADTHACEELQTRSHRYALKNFPEVMATEEFLLLPIEEVEELIGSNQLNVSSEEQAYEAVISWIKHDRTRRAVYLSRLMSRVRIPLLSRRFLMSTVDSDGLVRENGECKELLLEAMRYHLLPEKRGELGSERTVERTPDGMRPYIFSVGGSSLFAIHSEVECYNPRTDRWTSVAPLLTRRSRCGVGVVGKLLYAVGGYDGTSDLSTGEFYNPKNNKWTAIAPMGTRRSCLGLCSMDGLLYAVGGYDGASCLSSSERYDPLTGIWSCCPALSQRRRYCRLAALEGSVWAVGGLDASNALGAVERLDPREGKWVSVPSLAQRRSSAGLASLDGALYCVGGSDGSTCLQTAEKLDLRRMRWESIVSMNTRRSTHELVSIGGGTLYALGGNDGSSSSLSTCEKYDSRLNKWSVFTSMLTRRSCLGAAVLDCLSMDKISSIRTSS